MEGLFVFSEVSFHTCVNCDCQWSEASLWWLTFLHFSLSAWNVSPSFFIQSDPIHSSNRPLLFTVDLLTTDLFTSAWQSKRGVYSPHKRAPKSQWKKMWIKRLEDIIIYKLILSWAIAAPSFGQESESLNCFHLALCFPAIKLVPFNSSGTRWGESGLSPALEHNRQWRVRIHPPNWKTQGYRLTEMYTISLAMRKSFSPLRCFGRQIGSVNVLATLFDQAVFTWPLWIFKSRGIWDNI